MPNTPDRDFNEARGPLDPLRNTGTEEIDVFNELQHRVQRPSSQNCGLHNPGTITAPTITQGPSLDNYGVLGQVDEVVHGTARDSVHSSDHTPLDALVSPPDLLKHNPELSTVPPQNSSILVISSAEKFAITDKTINLLKYYAHHVAPWVSHDSTILFVISPY